MTGARAERAVSVALAAQLACLLEASAPKPGNVSPGHPFVDLRYEDFLASAVAIGEPLAGAAARGLGETICLAVEATARWTQSNSNLGIVLLLAPLAKAAGSDPLTRPDSRGLTPETLREAVREVLGATTVDDARQTYVAIRRARPGGLGTVDTQDVSRDPTGTLLDVMRLAADRDTIAREYATGFDLTFGLGVPVLTRARREGLSWDDAVVETFLTVLASVPDTHIARRGGADLAQRVSARARQVLAEGGVRSTAGRAAIESMDGALRDARNSGNAGTTADLMAAALFVVLLCGGFDAVSW
jgi:triphosphoribosyl-dephospho-CoA synthase